MEHEEVQEEEHDFEDGEEDLQPQPGELPLGWVFFSASSPWLYSATELLREKLGVSQGAAEVKLRKACGEGMVRSMKALCDLGATKRFGAPCIESFKNWDRIAPKEWREREVDFDPQPEPSQEPQPKWAPKGSSWVHHGFEIVVSSDDLDFAFWPDAPPGPKGTRKAGLVQQAIEAVWPGGVPKDLLNKQIEREVGDWLKQRGYPPISRDTILRTAGRK
jgi:hypothetical protein